MQKNSSQDAGARIVKRPAHQEVYETLRDRILFGEMAPAQAVTIQGLTNESGAGMTPVREAIRRLISDGALKMLGNRRIIVPELTAGCIDELFFMRNALEPHLARLAAAHVTESDLSRLTQLDASINDAIRLGDIGGYLKQNYRFHTDLYAVAGAPVIAATVDRLWLRFGPSLRVVCGRYGTLNLPDKHADLLDALRRGDAAAAETAMAGDVSQGINQIREALPQTA